LSRLEHELLAKPWHEARRGAGELCAGRELYVFAESKDRVAKERAMRRRSSSGSGAAQQLSRCGSNAKSC